MGSYHPHSPDKRSTQLLPQVEIIEDSIPDKARVFLAQALETLHAPAASIMVSASAIDAMLKDKGYKQGSLYARIGKAAEDHLLTPGMADWAHVVRLEANDQRHADEYAVDPTVEDAQRIVKFAMAVGEFLYVLPARVQKEIDEAQPAAPAAR